MEKLREEVISNLRASLISTKGKCDLRQIRSDYKMLMGCEIPYKKFGYNTLEDFLYSVDSLTISQGPNGLLVSAKSTEKSSHMVDLISKQKTAPKKKKIFVRPERRNYGHRMAPPTDSRWRPKNVSNKWKTSYQSTARPATLAHNQFVNVPMPQKKSPEPMPPRFHRQPPATNNNNNVDTDLRKYLNSKQQVKSDPKDLRHLLNQKKAVSFESDSSASSSSSDLLQPYSAKTNCAALMQGIPARRNCPPVLTSMQIENLKNNSLASVDTQSTVWDSWTSGEEGDIQKVNKDFKATGDSMVDLFSFTQNRKLPEPVFKVIQRKGKPHKMSFYDCHIKVGTHSYTSYPKDFTDEVSAKQWAAKEALDDLIKTYSKRKSLLLSTELDILSRIPPMVEKHFHGIWNWQLEADYADLYHEQLPLNWMQIVDMSPMISVEAFLDNKYVLRFCKPEDKGKRPHGGLVSEVSVPSNTVTFKEDEMLMATVTCVVSAKEIWCRQICTPESEAFDKMMESFERCYTQCMKFEDASRAKNVNVGGYYVAFFENNFYRVRVFEVNGDAEVSCFFIDYGDEQLIPRHHIYQLMREFAKEQAQAFICRLAGLEDLYEVSVNSSHLLALNERVVQMDTDSEETVKNDPSDPISVVLYDSDSNVSINEQLIAEITMESATPVFNRFGVTEAYVSHVENVGDVYLHIHSPGFEKLELLMSELELSLSENRPDIPRTIPTPENSKDRLYIAKYKEDDHWYRVKIIDWAPQDRRYAQIYFVDFGNCEVVKVAQETMYPLDELSDVINQFPAQAVKVRMVIDRVRPDFAEKVAQLMPNDQPVLLKVIETDNENVPWVKFFKRILPSNDLVSINESINLESEINESTKPEKLQRLHSLSRFDDLTSQNKNVPSAGILTSPPLPKVGEYLDVKVPCAVSPWNFFVQPYESNDKLSKLMMSLQTEYGNVTHSPLHIDDILPGRIYASKHDDGMWYRTSVIKVIHSGSISVFYCDFGYYASLTLQQLIPLGSQFMDLPYQAIKAKLAGIKPKQEKWTMDNCKNFQKLVVRKSFVSILTSIETDEMYRSDTVLNLKLIDTSTATDVHIDEILVKKDIAVELDK